MTRVFHLDRPAQEIIVELINVTNNTNYKPEELELVTVVPEPSTVIPYSTIPQQVRYRTHAVVRETGINAGTPITYFRLCLATYLYKDLVNEQSLNAPGVLIDRYPTSVATAIEDALAYLESEYKVILKPEDVQIISRPDLRAPDRTWPVSVALRRDHPVWVGSLVLTAYDPDEGDEPLPTWVSQLNGHLYPDMFASTWVSMLPGHDYPTINAQS